jgi:alpha-glucoside transport system substrate-binding protein
MPVATVALVVLAAGCGGGGGSSATGPVAGSVTVLGPWTEHDRQSFEAVTSDFMAANRGAKVTYRSARGAVPARLATAIGQGKPPDVAFVSDPGLLRELATKGELRSLDYLKGDAKDNLGDSAVSSGSVDGKLYGVLFKVRDDSTVWFNPRAFSDAAVSPPRTWKQLGTTASALVEDGTPAYSIGAADGDTLAYLFDNIYLRQAGADDYDRLASHKIPWTDDSVKAALTTLAELVSARSKVAGNPLATDYSESVSGVFQDNPSAAMVFGGDAVPTVVDPPNPVPVFFGRTAGADYDVFAFPSIDGSPPSVVGEADIAVALDDGPATKAFMDFLTTSDAASDWLQHGSFATLNHEATLSNYAFPDLISREIGKAVGRAQVFRFGLAALQPAGFGGSERMSRLLRPLLRGPSTVVAVAASLEAAAQKAYE